MNNLTNYLCYELIMMIFDLLSDRDKIQFSMANKYLTSFIPNIIWTKMYQYKKVRFLSYKNNFRKLSFKPRYDIIPPIITHLIIDEKFIGSLKNVVPKSVKKIYIDKNSSSKHLADTPQNIKVFCKCKFNKKYYPNKVSNLLPICCPYYTRIIDDVVDVYPNFFNYFDLNLCTEINNNFLNMMESYESCLEDCYVLYKSDFRNTSPEAQLALAIFLNSSRPIAQTERLCPDIQIIPKPKSKHKKIYQNHTRQKIPKRIMMPKQKFSKYRR
ncbi:F-box and FNIP repeat-containing protein [Megavirus baoshan]|uniref:F-box and FNIP repeat-containing protein n=1 Tax=Megavirus baoshan TaxID=2496520 RepID=A0A3Q8U898_9VIRU|nr:F-box and FNIP repeat-containing protein [Megavirus baoshan]AZL89625.1 F-box and FNIP repeat-containing protein [Megavirus baoshan]